MTLADYISTTDAAAIAGVNERHMRVLADNGKIAAVKIGRNWIVSKEAAEAFARHPSKGRPKSLPRKGKKKAKK